MKFFTLVCSCSECHGTHPLIMGHDDDCTNPEIFEAVRMFRSKALAEMEAEQVEEEMGERPMVAEFEIRRV
jgi:hypothetical protein